MNKYLYEDLYNLEEKHWWHISKRRVVQSVIKKFAKSKKPKILDVGCGTGKNVEDLKVLGSVWGLDNSKEAIRFCKKRGLTNIKQGDAQKTNLPSNSFDIVTLLDVLEHTDDNKTLKEMRRIIKNDGLLIITVPAFSWLWSKWDEVLHHKRRYTIENLKDVLASHNFTMTYSTYLYSFLVLPVLVIRKIKSNLLGENYGSDFKLSNPLLNFLLNILSRIEFSFSQAIAIPFGTSIVMVAKNEKK